MSLQRLAVAPGPFLVDAEVEQNTRTGSSTQRVWEGSFTEVYNKRALDQLNGASSVKIQPMHNGLWRLESYFPFDENGIESVPVPGVHELDVQTLIPSVWINPKVRSLFNAEALSIIQKAVKDYESGFYPRDGTSSASADAESDISTQLGRLGASAQTIDYSIRLFRDVAYRKADSYMSFTSVYRRTFTAASPLQIQASYNGVGKIWTSDEVMLEENLNFNEFFWLDPGKQWLKTKPQIASVANQKTQVSYTYIETEFATWFQYDAYAGAVLFNAP